MNNKVESFSSYYFGTITRPGRTFESLLLDDHRLKFGIFALALNTILYTLVYVFLTIGGGAPSIFRPWLAIPPEQYYYYNQFFLAPSMFAGWIMSAGVARLISCIFSGKGSFIDTLSVFGFAISIACLASLLHDLPDAFLGVVGLLDLKEYEIALNTPTIWRAILWTLYGISIVWFMLLFVKGIRVVHKIRTSQAILVGIPSYLVYQFFFVIFNR